MEGEEEGMCELISWNMDLLWKTKGSCAHISQGCTDSINLQRKKKNSLKQSEKRISLLEQRYLASRAFGGLTARL